VAIDDGGGPLRVHIRILDDGAVVFGDLDRRLAEVAAVLCGDDPTAARAPEGPMTSEPAP
jgi:hypothetical protein